MRSDAEEKPNENAGSAEPDDEVLTLQFDCMHFVDPYPIHPAETESVDGWFRGFFAPAKWGKRRATEYRKLDQE